MPCGCVKSEARANMSDLGDKISRENNIREKNKNKIKIKEKTKQNYFY